MIPVYYDSKFLAHATVRHPERPERLQAIVDRLGSDSARGLVDWRACQPARLDAITAVHPAAYIQGVELLSAAGGGWLDSDTYLNQHSFEVARLACGAACQAVDEVIAGGATSAFCAIRPPGHHAETSRGMGFCLFNNVAVAAQWAIEHWKLNRVMIVDWDVHHGNGTQEIFWERSDVGYFSIHRFPFYPGTGSGDEIGAGEGLGFTLNCPIEFGTRPSEFIAEFRQGVEQLAARVRPELILVSAGFDAYAGDPIGSLGLGAEHFAELTNILKELSRGYCPGKIVSLLEGGYDLDGLARCTEYHLRALAAG